PDHGHPVRRLRGRLPGAGRAQSLARRHARRPAHHLGYLRSVLPVDLSRRPFMETLRNNKALSAALSAITAAIVGVILNLAAWFALHVLVGELREIQAPGMVIDLPVLSTVNMPSLILTLSALIAVFWFRIGMLPVLAGCSIAGLVYGLAIGLA